MAAWNNELDDDEFGKKEEREDDMKWDGNENYENALFLSLLSSLLFLSFFRLWKRWSRKNESSDQESKCVSSSNLSSRRVFGSLSTRKLELLKNGDRKGEKCIKTNSLRCVYRGVSACGTVTHHSSRGLIALSILEHFSSLRFDSFLSSSHFSSFSHWKKNQTLWRKNTIFHPRHRFYHTWAPILSIVHQFKPLTIRIYHFGTSRKNIGNQSEKKYHSKIPTPWRALVLMKGLSLNPQNLSSLFSNDDPFLCLEAISLSPSFFLPSFNLFCPSLFRCLITLPLITTRFILVRSQQVFTWMKTSPRERIYFGTKSSFWVKVSSFSGVQALLLVFSLHLA